MQACLSRFSCCQIDLYFLHIRSSIIIILLIHVNNVITTTHDDLSDVKMSLTMFIGKDKKRLAQEVYSELHWA